MSFKIWIKLYIEMLDNSRVGMLPDWVFRRFIQFLLVAGECDHEGLLEPVPQLAWRLRSSQDDMLNALRTLRETGMVAETPDGWKVVNFAKRQAVLTSTERSRNSRNRNDHAAKRCNDRSEVAAGDSTSTSTSSSDSEEEGFQREEEQSALPGSPGEALLNPDLQIYQVVTGGRIPAESHYRQLIDAIQFLRSHKNLDNPALKEYLQPFWQAWSSRKRKDGRPYDPSNPTWLAEWALNGSIPAVCAEPVRSRVASVDETRQKLEELAEKSKAAVPMPESAREQMRAFQKRNGKVQKP
jgi:hypothetical protein